MCFFYNTVFIFWGDIVLFYCTVFFYLCVCWAIYQGMNLWELVLSPKIMHDSVPRKSTDLIKRSSAGGERVEKSGFTRRRKASLLYNKSGWSSSMSFWINYLFTFSFPHELFGLKVSIMQTGMPMTRLPTMGSQGTLTTEIITLKTFENVIKI